MKIFIHSDDEEILKYAIALMKMITNRCSNYNRAENKNSIKNKNRRKTKKDSNKEKNKGKIKKSKLDRDEKKKQGRTSVPVVCRQCL